MDNSNRTDIKPLSNQSKNISTSPEIKALALLARDKASNSPSFIKGNKVNASAFKNHIVKLANNYNISEHGLKSIDDKISKALYEYDLRGMPDTKVS